MSPFPEEQLDSPVGYFPAQPGQTLKDGRWGIVRKLGCGPRSSTWLAFNSSNKKQHRAIKILTAAATEDPSGNKERNLLLGLVKSLNLRPTIPEFPVVESHFFEKDMKGKRHLCLISEVLGPSVEDLRLQNAYHGEHLPIHIVQRVIGNIAERLVKLAEQKLIHGAVTADNFLFRSVQNIQRTLARYKSERAENILGSDGVTYPSVKSQPIPHGYKWDCGPEDIMYATFCLNNYAHAHTSPIGSAVILDYRKNFLPPEALQGGRVDCKSDVWMLGCTTYLLLTGASLFSDSYITSPVKTATETLGKLENLLRESGRIKEKDILPTTSFLRSCLAIKPAKRAGAAEVVSGGWVKKSTACSCGWDGH